MNKNKNKNALIMVDLQNDFCQGGALEVPDGDAVIPLANQLQLHYDLVVATQDWHPKHHLSFASHHKGRKVGDVIKIKGVDQVLWPDHCVQQSKGAELHPQLHKDHIHKIFQKGTDPAIDSYSAFFDNAHLRETGLADYLQKEKVKDVYVMGLATDYCVKYSCLDAISLGFKVYLIEDACRGVELQKGDIDKAIKEMRNAGVKIVDSSKV